MSPTRHRRLIVALLVVAVLGTACSQDEEVVPEPEAVETCDGLVDVGAQLVRAYVRVLEELRVDDLTADDVPAEFVELERIGGDLDLRASRLGCSAADLNEAIAAEVADLETDAPAARLMLDLVEEGIIGRLPAPPPTTATTTLAP